MSTMYSRSVAMLRQAKNAILSVSEDDAFLLYRKDRLWRSLKLKIARTEAGINIGRHCLEDIKTFYSSLVGK